MSEKGQFSLGLDSSPVQKPWTAYTPAERERLGRIVVEKRAAGQPLTPEEAAFDDADREHFQSDDQRRWR